MIGSSLFNSNESTLTAVIQRTKRVGSGESHWTEPISLSTSFLLSLFWSLLIEPLLRCCCVETPLDSFSQNSWRTHRASRMSGSSFYWLCFAIPTI